MANMLSPNYENAELPASISMKVQANYEDKDKVMCAEFWPKGIKVRGWRQ